MDFYKDILSSLAIAKARVIEQSHKDSINDIIEFYKKKSSDLGYEEGLASDITSSEYNGFYKMCLSSWRILVQNPLWNKQVIEYKAKCKMIFGDYTPSDIEDLIWNLEISADLPPMIPKDSKMCRRYVNAYRFAKDNDLHGSLLDSARGAVKTEIRDLYIRGGAYQRLRELKSEIKQKINEYENNNNSKQ